MNDKKLRCLVSAFEKICLGTNDLHGAFVAAFDSSNEFNPPPDIHDELIEAITVDVERGRDATPAAYQSEGDAGDKSVKTIMEETVSMLLKDLRIVGRIEGTWKR